MLRWIKAGNNGFSVPAQPHNIQHESYGFADDCIMFSDKLQKLATMLRQLISYSKWAHLQINVKKCALLATMHQSAPKELKNDVGMLRKRVLALLPQLFHNVPILKAGEAYKYLGIYICPNLSWNVNYRSCLQKVTDKLVKIVNWRLSLKNTIVAINTMVVPIVTYSMGHAFFTAKQLRTLNGAVAKGIRMIPGFKMGVPTDLILSPQELGGFGVTNLKKEYLFHGIQNYFQLYNNTTNVGDLFRWDIARAAKRFHKVVVHSSTWSATRWPTLAWRLHSLLLEAQLLNEGSTVDPPDPLTI